MSSETADGGHMEKYVDPSKQDDMASAITNDDSPQQQQLPSPATTTTTTTTATATNLAESAKQQQDREFFRKFLAPNGPGRECEDDAATGTNAQTNHEESVGTIPQSCSNASGLPEATNTIENLLNRTTAAAATSTIGRPTTSWSTAPYSSIPPIYSTFGFDMGYRPAASSSNNIDNNLDSNQLQSTATSLIYDGLFADGGEDLFRGGLLSSDNLSMSNLATIKGGGGYNSANILGRTYAESQHQLELSILQQQQQQDQLLHEQVGNLSLFDSNDRPIDHPNLRGQVLSSDFGQHASDYQQPNAQSRLLNSFMSNSFNQSYPSTSSSGASGYHRYGGSNLMTASGRSNNTPPHQRDGSDKILHHHHHQSHNFIAATINNSSNKSRRNKLPFFAANAAVAVQQHSATSEHSGQQYGSGSTKLDAYGSMNSSSGGNNANGSGRFSRKVFVGGLPPDIDEEEIKASFRRFGALVVDWPHKAESKSYFPPKGYAFLLFQEEVSVQALIDACFQEDDKLYLCVSSPTIKDKPVQIRPWRLSDTDFVLDSARALDPRKTVFVGGVPRPLKASELANIMNNLYGGVCYAGIDTDPELKYPKGAGRVAFSNYRSYITAISARFVHIQHSEIEKQVEVKPYVLDDQFCDECQDSRGGNKFAPFFCANITCLRYYCDNCWSAVHSQAGKELHKPLVKEGGDRPRGAQSFRW